jgi:hypothetical protein
LQALIDKVDQLELDLRAGRRRAWHELARLVIVAGLGFAVGFLVR